MSDFTDITTIPPVCVVTTGDEDSLKRFHVPVNGTAKDGISVLLERSDNGVRIYLTADDTPVSWVRLTFPAEFLGMTGFARSDRLGLAFLVNDNDGNGRKGFLSWGGGIGIRKDPGLYNLFIFK